MATASLGAPVVDVATGQAMLAFEKMLCCSTVNCFLIICDQTRVLYVSPTAPRVLGRAVEEVRGCGASSESFCDAILARYRSG